MKRSIYIFAALMAFASPAVYAEEAKEVELVLAKCEKPVASVTVGTLTCKASACKSASAGRDSMLSQLLSMAGQPNMEGIGEGMGDMMVSIMKSTGCFNLQERQAMDDINKELALVGKKVEAEPADFIISGSVTQISLEQDRSNFGFGLIPIIGSVSSTTQTAEVALDLRLIDVQKAKILESQSFVAKSSKTSWGMGGGGSIGVAGFGGTFSKLNGTALEVVAKQAMVEAVNFMVARLSVGPSN
jgi:curli biogenesis system outer membrane secretion channel CsgG